MMKSIVAVPLPVASAFVIGGVSCEGDSAAVNRVVVEPPGVEGDEVVELEPEQPVKRSTPNSPIARRFICGGAPLIRRICA
jgi:hypothetical protein